MSKADDLIDEILNISPSRKRRQVMSKFWNEMAEIQDEINEERNLRKYLVPYTFINGKQIRWIETWAGTIAEAVTNAHNIVDVRHDILVERVRRA